MNFHYFFISTLNIYLYCIPAGEVVTIANIKPWEKVGLTEKQFREVQYQANLELARRNFWHFCKLLAPDFYMEGRDYLKHICQEFQEFYESDEFTEEEKNYIWNEAWKVVEDHLSNLSFGGNSYEK